MLACVLCLGACSGTTFVYNRLDTILPWYVDDYVELDATQERQLEEILRPFLHWHRQQELPRYVELLNQLDSSLDHEVTPTDLANIYDEMQVAWLRLEQESLDGLLELGASLSDAQVQEFLAYMRERQDEYEEEYLTRSGSEYREEIYDNFADTLEDYLGRLTTEQKERLRGIGKWLKLNGEAIYGSRPWLIFGEGPTETPVGHLSDTGFDGFSEKDIRFTTQGDTLYAIALGWPNSGTLNIEHLGTKHLPETITAVRLIGHDESLVWKQGTHSLEITLPKSKPCEHAFVFAVSR